MSVTTEQVNNYLSKKLISYAKQKRDDSSLKPLFISQSELCRKLGAESVTDKETIIQCASSFIESNNARMEEEGVEELMIDTDIREEEMERARIFREDILGTEDEKEVRISVKETYLIINEHEISPPSELFTFTELLGEPDRLYELQLKGTILHIYDNLGLIVLEEPDIAQVTQLNIYYSNVNPFAPYPSYEYSGVFELSGLQIIKSHTLAQVKRLLPHLTFKRLEWNGTCYQSEFGKFSIVFLNDKPFRFLLNKMGTVLIRFNGASQ